MADDEDETFDFATWLGDSPDEAEGSIMETVAKAAVSLPWGLTDALLGDDEKFGPEDVFNTAIGPLAAPAVNDLLGDDDDDDDDDDAGPVSDALGSLIDKASEALHDVGSRLSDAVDDIGERDDDNDSVSNAEEIRIGSDPMKSDTDGDTINDGTELHDGTDPRLRDTDGDGRNDWQERKDDTDPKDDLKFNESSPDERLSDPLSLVYDLATEALSDAVDRLEDVDRDGLTNVDELRLGTHPLLRDTDDDGLDDGDEVRYTTDPVVNDSDGDHVDDGDEVRLGSNPKSKDTDDDEVPDLVEYARGTLGPPPGDDPFAGSDRDNWVETEHSDGVTDDSLAFDITQGGPGGPELSFKDAAVKRVGDFGEAARDRVVGTAKSVAATADDVVGDIATRFEVANAGQAETRLPRDSGATPEPKPPEVPEISEPAADDAAIAGPDLEVEVPALAPIPDAPDPVDIEGPIAAAFEESPAEVLESEPLQDHIENIDESMDSLTDDFDDSTD